MKVILAYPNHSIDCMKLDFRGYPEGYPSADDRQKFMDLINEACPGHHELNIHVQEMRDLYTDVYRRPYKYPPEEERKVGDFLVKLSATCWSGDKCHDCKPEGLDECRECNLPQPMRNNILE